MQETQPSSKIPADILGKPVALNGATGGIGSALAERLAEEGAELLLLVRDVKKGEALAGYAEDAIRMAAEARERITDPITVYYSISSDGLEAIAEGNFHGEVIEKIGAKNVVSSVFGASQGDVSMEQLYIWDPDVILLSEKEAYERAITDPMWTMLRAVEEGNVYLVPSEPYSFIDAPPATNRIIGIYWLGNLLYPELYPVDVVDKMIEYYDLYYSYDLTEEHAKAILHI